jgi:hypothetical protein
VSGFILIEARDLYEAVRIAAGIPMARLGSIEVRPVVDSDGACWRIRDRSPRASVDPARSRSTDE